MRHIGPLIRELRLNKGTGLNEFADMLSMDPANLSRFERDEGGIKLPESLYPMAEALGTSVPAIFLMLERVIKDETLLLDKQRLAQLFKRVNSAISKI